MNAPWLIDPAKVPEDFDNDDAFKREVKSIKASSEGNGFYQ